MTDTAEVVKVNKLSSRRESALAIRKENLVYWKDQLGKVEEEYKDVVKKKIAMCENEILTLTNKLGK